MRSHRVYQESAASLATNFTDVAVCTEASSKACTYITVVDMAKDGTFYTQRKVKNRERPTDDGNLK